MHFWPKKKVSEKDTTLGQVLLRMGAVTPSELEEALSEQGDRMLGDVFVSRGTLGTLVLEEALAFQREMRSGKAVDVMLDILERKTEHHHKRATFKSMAAAVV